MAPRSKSTDAPKRDTIPVRMTIVVHVDPKGWAAGEPEVEFDQVKAALVAAGLSNEAANRAAVAATSAKTDGTNAVRERVRAYVLGAVRELPELERATVTEERRSRSRKA